MQKYFILIDWATKFDSMQNLASLKDNYECVK